MTAPRGQPPLRAGEPAATPPVDARHLLDDDAAAKAWGVACGLLQPEDAGRLLRGIAEQGITFDLLGDLCTRLTDLLPAVSDPDRVLAALGRLIAAVSSPLSTATLFQRDPASLETLLRIFSAGPYLADVVIADPASWEEVRLGQGKPESMQTLRTTLEGMLAGRRETESAMLALRRFKRREMLRIAYGDLVGEQPLETVTRQISRVADCVIDAALRLAVARFEAERGTPRGPGGERAEIAVLALGKLGGEELNYSSDVDLVFVSTAEGRVAGPKPCTNQEFFERVVREVVRLVAEPNPAGSGHRVDLRLRPHGATGPLVLPLDATLRYFDREARTWERQAWVKARCVGGATALGERLLSSLAPWIYRRWLSAADISEIKALKRRMERKVADEGRADYDVKLGSGGIRDIEYAIQFLQLLGGGDTPAVRTGNTIEAMHRLTEAGALTDQERTILDRNYRLLRKLEHRLQILSDAQTHTLPADDRELGRLAVRAGYDPGPDGLQRLRDDLAAAKTLNRRILDHLLHDAFPDDTVAEPETDLVLDPRPADEATHELFLRHGFRDPDTARRTFQSLAEERARFLSTRRCRHFLAAIAPRLLATIGRTPDPDATLLQLAAVADSLGGKGVLWELFSFNPPSLDLTVQLCASSPFLAGILVGNPGMIDELLDSLVVERLPTPEGLDEELGGLCHGAVDIGPIVHTFKVSEQLRVGVREVLGRLDTEATTRALTAIGETVLRAVVGHEQTRLMQRLGRPMVGGDPSGALVLAMGKFGGREINYRSDLDIVFLYDHDGESVPLHPESRVQGSTSNAHFFAELAQRTMKACNTLTPQGRLYEVDSRLRPSGRSGAAAVSLDELARWFAAEGPAAVWERQALLKARPVIGAEPARRRFAAIRAAAIWGRSWSAADVAEIRHNRLRMEQGATVANLKRGPGGVVDIEFLVQVLQLVHGATESRLQTTETLAGLVALHDLGLIPTASFAFLSDAYRFLRRIEGRLQLLGAKARHDFPPPGDDRRTLARLMGHEQADDLAAEVARTTVRVREEFDEVFRRTAAALA
jgi:glutamate-ammonia-ligase adenylyltransferase